MTTISIAMATYNGEAWLRDQLNSIAAQHLWPDELVISDDSSSDNTVEIIQAFAKNAVFPVRLHVNSKPLGVRENFSRAIAQCQGALIFLSDQDDVWLPHKIQRMAAYSRRHRHPYLVTCDARYGNADLSVLGRPRLQYLRQARGKRNTSHIMGCCTLITRAFARVALPIPRLPLNHDHWLHELAKQLEQRHVMEDVLQLYRRHGSNTAAGFMNEDNTYPRLSYLRAQLGTPNTVALGKRLELLRAVQTRLNEVDDEHLPVNRGRTPQQLHAELQATKKRLELLCRGRRERLAGLVRLLHEGGYNHFNGLRSFANDLIRTRGNPAP